MELLDQKAPPNSEGASGQLQLNDEILLDAQRLIVGMRKRAESGLLNEEEFLRSWSLVFALAMEFMSSLSQLQS